jgi:hypothetical protein
LEFKDEKVNVIPFSEDYTALHVPIASICMVWENPNTGELWMMVLHEALYFGQQFKDSLICPHQMRAAGAVTIEDTPIQFYASSSHSVQGMLEIPLEMLGVISHYGLLVGSRQVRISSIP